MKLALKLAAAMLGCGLALPQAGLAQDVPFADEIHVFGIEDEVYPPQGCETLFVGSSSFRFWFAMAQDFPRTRLLKRGFGGSQISDINFHFDRVVGRYRPARIAFYAGENDIDAGKSPDAIMADLARFMSRKTAALGTTPVFYVSAKPSLARWAQFEQQSLLNRMVAQMANERDDLVYVDIVSAMMKDGKPDPALFISDGLHMKSDGYKLWREQIRAAFHHARTSKAPGC
ncbi:MAG: GDSL-type esterase/lipase family protein [Erythrobacter sp.]|nr:GDSL-type esterase/lipase family protein [Erythrobacter sp.]MDZ4273610.1 GDSL-type esterase/lipase family protein [Erythrobacter sp.]